MATTYKVVKVPTEAGHAFGVVNGNSTEREVLLPTLYDTEDEAQAEADALHDETKKKIAESEDPWLAARQQWLICRSITEPAPYKGWKRSETPDL